MITIFLRRGVLALFCFLMNGTVIGAGQVDGSVYPSSLRLRPLESVTVVIVHKISAQRVSKTIPLGSELVLGTLKISPISCQAMKRADQQWYEYQAKFKVNRGKNAKETEESLTTEEDAPRFSILNAIYAIFLEKCTFSEE